MKKAALVINIWTEGRRKLPKDLPEAFAEHAEHVASMVEQGYTSGEIVDEKFSGWWSIKPDENL